MAAEDPEVVLNIGRENQTNSGPVNSQRSLQISKYEIHKVLGICRLVFWAIGLFLGPLVIYTFFIDYHGKLVQVDRSFGVAIFAVHAVVDFINIILYVILEPLDDGLQIGAGILHICWSISCMFPLSLVIFVHILTTNTHSVWYEVMPLLLQALVRAIQLLTLSARTIRPSANYCRWVLMFFYLYALCGQVFGALWYGGAIYTQTKCWQETNRLCLGNTTEYDFGVFYNVHQSGILEMRGSALKILYCFGWAIQKISGLGSNLEAVGTGVLENLFAIFICFTSLMLFYFLFGQIQVYLQSRAKKSMDMEEHLREIHQFMPFERLPEDIQTELIQQKCKQSVSGEPRRVNIVSMLDGLFEDLRGKITKQLCLELVQRVEEFRNWDNASLAELFANLKPAFYSKHTNIIQEKDTVDKIIFVVQGELWGYATDSEESPTSSVRINDSFVTGITAFNDQRNDHLNEGFCGEELVVRLRTNAYTLRFPRSKRTIQAVTNVEAFILTACHLRKIFINRREAEIAAQGANTSHAS